MDHKPLPVGVDDFEKLVKSLKKEIQKTMEEMKNMTKEELVEERYQKFRNMGEYKKY